MITFSKFGKHGNLGNQLHQLASLIGFAEKYKCDLVLPPWKYAQFFTQPPHQAVIKNDMLITEQSYHYIPEFWDRYAHCFKTHNVDILGWLQTEKYWEHCREKVFSALQFTPEIVKETKLKFSKALQKKTIAVSIRRGDFVTDPNFYVLPIKYYLFALVKHFPDHKNYNIIVFSDDFDFCRKHIRATSNTFFATGLKAIGQLCLMSLCDHFIISNSTFSWWGAMLGEKPHTKVIRSPYQLEGKLLKEFNTKDYYPERWLVYDHIGASEYIKDLTCSRSFIAYSKIIKHCFISKEKLRRRISG